MVAHLEWPSVYEHEILSSKPLDFLTHSEPPKSNYLDQSTVINVFCSKDLNVHDSMIHITVPDTQVLVEKKDGVTRYTAFNIHVNGWFHAAVRFSHLHQFAEVIKQKFSSKNLKLFDFPSKHWNFMFSLDERALEERKTKISKYLNSLVQSPEIVRSSYVEKSFLAFQVHSYPATSTNVSLDIYLGDGHKLIIKCNLSQSTDEIMKKISEQLGNVEHDRFLRMFGLFMGKPRYHQSLNKGNDSFDMLIVRLMRNFESPYASLQTANKKSAAHGLYYKLLLRKLIWEPRIEETLLEDDIAVDLLYRQAKLDYHNGHFSVIRPETTDRLRALEKSEDKIQFLRTCHLLPSYSHEILSSCRSDSPQPNTMCQLKIGRRQIVLTTDDEERRQRIFRATRIHVWRISQPAAPDDSLIFQFEYLMAKDTFEWITLYTDQAILISLLIQSMGTEILRERSEIMIEEQLLRQNISIGASALECKTNRPITTSAGGKNFLLPVNNIGESKYSLDENMTEERGKIDPLNLICHNDVFTTITDTLPLHNEVNENITDDDL